jgi:hypothetical protein
MLRSPFGFRKGRVPQSKNVVPSPKLDNEDVLVSVSERVQEGKDQVATDVRPSEDAIIHEAENTNFFLGNGHPQKDLGIHGSFILLSMKRLVQ